MQGSQRAIAATQRTSTHYFQRPDSAALNLSYDTTLTSLTGYIGELALAKNGDTFGSIAVKTSSPALELNDLGLQGRTGYTRVSTLIGRQSYTAGKHLNSWAASPTRTRRSTTAGAASSTAWPQAATRPSSTSGE